MDVTVRAAAEPSDEGGGVVLVPILRNSKRAELYRERIVLQADERLRLVYTYAPGRAVTGVQAQLMARSPQGGAYELDFQRARISLIREGERPGAGVQVRQQEIDRI